MIDNKLKLAHVAVDRLSLAIRRAVQNALQIMMKSVVFS